MAHSFGALVVPVSIVNAEYLNPWNVCLSWVNALGRKLGFPFIPIGTCVLQALLPATYLNPRPAKLTYVLHRPIDFKGGTPKTYSELKAEAEAFRQDHQVRLDFEVKAQHPRYNQILRGRNPNLYKVLRPYLWHELFLRTAGEPDWFAALYKVPIGYPMIAIARLFTPADSRTADE